MTDPAESIEEAFEDRDITLAFTPGQLVLLVVGVFVLLRIIRGLRR
ncbi:MAG: hypothetical protein ACRDFY_04270 [Candidatus Limnocylindria bacterium]